MNEIIELTDNKTALLNALTEAIKDSVVEYQDIARIASDHPIVYAGNPEAEIMIVQMAPNGTEQFWAEHEETNTGKILINVEGTKFKQAATKVGFDVEKDFFYTNIIPFMPTGEQAYEPDIVNRFLWIFQSVFDIIKPKIIITLGYDPLCVVVDGTIDKPTYIHLLKRIKNAVVGSEVTFESKLGILEYDNVYVVPLEHPDILEKYDIHSKFASYEHRLSLLKSTMPTFNMGKPNGTD